MKRATRSRAERRHQPKWSRRRTDDHAVWIRLAHRRAARCNAQAATESPALFPVDPCQPAMASMKRRPSAPRQVIGMACRRVAVTLHGDLLCGQFRDGGGWAQPGFSDVLTSGRPESQFHISSPILDIESADHTRLLVHRSVAEYGFADDHEARRDMYRGHRAIRVRSQDRHTRTLEPDSAMPVAPPDSAELAAPTAGPSAWGIRWSPALGGR